MIGFGVSTADGTAWSEPIQLEGTQSHYIWRVAAQGGTAYMSARRRRGFFPGEVEDPPEEIECVLLESHDGVRWRVAGGCFAESFADETAFLFEPDGSILGIVRGTPGAPDTRIVRAEWPYSDSEWSRARTGVAVGGPLLVRWGGRTIVGGRHRTGGGSTGGDVVSTTYLWELEGEATLTPLVEVRKSMRAPLSARVTSAAAAQRLALPAATLRRRLLLPGLRPAVRGPRARVVVQLAARRHGHAAAGEHTRA